MSRVSFSMDAEAVIRELDRLADGPGAGPTAFRLESILAHSFAEVSARVHVLTGGLKASGHPASEYDGSTWTGTLYFARHPGIFELARGNTPTLNHPEGGHYFFAPAYDTPDEYKAAIMEFLAGGRHG